MYASTFVLWKFSRRHADAVMGLIAAVGREHDVRKQPAIKKTPRNKELAQVARVQTLALCEAYRATCTLLSSRMSLSTQQGVLPLLGLMHHDHLVDRVLHVHRKTGPRRSRKTPHLRAKAKLAGDHHIGL